MILCLSNESISQKWEYVLIRFSDIRDERVNYVFQTFIYKMEDIIKNCIIKNKKWYEEKRKKVLLLKNVI